MESAWTVNYKLFLSKFIPFGRVFVSTSSTDIVMYFDQSYKEGAARVN
jgi:hypothetical protein